MLGSETVQFSLFKHTVLVNPLGIDLWPALVLIPRSLNISTLYLPPAYSLDVF